MVSLGNMADADQQIQALAEVVHAALQQTFSPDGLSIGMPVLSVRCVGHSCCGCLVCVAHHRHQSRTHRACARRPLHQHVVAPPQMGPLCVICTIYAEQLMRLLCCVVWSLRNIPCAYRVQPKAKLRCASWRLHSRMCCPCPYSGSLPTLVLIYQRSRFVFFLA